MNASETTTTTTPAPAGPAPQPNGGGGTRRVFAVSIRIVRQFLRDRRSLALLFVAPLLVMTILNLVLNNTTAGVTLGIVPPDGPLGSALVSQIKDHTKDQSGLTITTVARDQVDATLSAGNADGVLVFPADLASEIASGQTPQLTLRLEGSNPTAAKQLHSLTSLLIASLAQSATPGSAPSAAGGVAVVIQPALSTTYLYGGPEFTQTDALAPLFIGLFALFFVFLLTSVSFLRERSQGTIERLLVSPLTKTELVLGYVFGFLLFALAQSLVILLFVIYVLQVHYKGNLALLFLVTLALTVVGVNMGIFVSSLSRNELQVIQFIPLLLVPQALLGGLFFPVSTLPVVLKQIAYALPLTYANFALKDVMLRGFGFDQIWPELAILVGFAALMVVLAAVSLRQDRV
jgi:ABC-2 type transport system permease protein